MINRLADWWCRAPMRARPWLTHPRLPLAAALLTLLLCSPALPLGLVGDDFAHRGFFLNGGFDPNDPQPVTEVFAPLRGDPQITQRWIDSGAAPWWTDLRLKLAFWRPLASLTHAFDWRTHQSPFLMHLHSLLWLAALVVLAGAAYRRLIGPTWTAGVATLLFAIEDAHGFVAAWIANRNALIASTFGVAALLMHAKWRRSDGPSRATGVAAPLLLMLAFLGGETGIAATMYMIAFTLTLEHGNVWRRAAALAPALLVTAAWWLTYKLGGYGAAYSGLYIDPGSEPIRYLAAVFERGPILMLGQWLTPPADFYYLAADHVPRYMTAAGVAVLLLLAVMMRPLLLQSRVARFFALGMLLSTALACATLPNDRLLIMPGFGALGLLACYFEHVMTSIPSANWLKWTRRFGVGVLVLVHVVSAPLLLPVRAWSPTIPRNELRMYDFLPAPANAEQELVFVNAPNTFHHLLVPSYRDAQGAPAWSRMWALADGTQPVTVTRTDRWSLRVRPARGFYPTAGSDPAVQPQLDQNFDPLYGAQRLALLFRDPRRAPVSRPDTTAEDRGKRVAITPAFEVWLLQTTADGRPHEVLYVFDDPLDSDRWAWIVARNWRFESWRPPAIGETVVIPPVTQ